VDAVVETRFGRVRGSARRGVVAFRGIPYGRPVEGALRFALPRPPEPWPGIRDCAASGPGAPQRSAMPGWLSALVGNPREIGLDCLRLHVFTPSADGARRPVLFWIHGGGFVFGAGGSPVYHAGSLARDHDVVVVAINYRLGALGFGQLASLVRDERFAWNAGLEDQLAALAWVREHAASFGGDPENITVFGESAGAMSIGALLGMPGACARFARAICQSGAAHHCSSAEGAARAAHGLLRALDLSPARAPALLEIPIDALVDAQARATASAPLRFGLLPWQPAVDGARLAAAPLDAIAAGSARGVELLIGTNRDEYNLFLLSRAVRRMDEARLATATARVLGEAHAPEALALYRALRPHAAPIERWSLLQTHRVFRAPAERLASLQARHAQVFSYLFTWTSALAPSFVGSCHALEIPLLFDTWRRPALRWLYAGGRPLARSLQASWAAFARSGKPADPAWTAHRDGAAPFVLGPADERALAEFEQTRGLWTAHGHGPVELRAPTIAS
jgi:para-nitrobenzyl esterase